MANITPVTTPKEQPQPQPKSREGPPPISVKPQEMLTKTEWTPEEKKPVELEDGTETLINTIVDQFGNIDKNKQSTTPLTLLPAQEAFYEAFKNEYRDVYKKIDYSKPEEVIAFEAELKTCARKFLEKGGLEVRAIMKLAEVEAMSYQAVCKGFLYIKDGKPETINVPVSSEDEEIMEMTASGVEETSRHVGWFSGIKTKKEVKRIRYKLVNGTTMDLDPTSNTLISQEQANFLKVLGWTGGALDADQIKKIRNRIKAITRMRKEIYTKLGLTDLSQIELNFIKDDKSDYLGSKIKYLTGESGIGDARTRLLAEAVSYTTEEKKKVEDAIAKRDKEDDEKVIREATISKLQARLEEVRRATTLNDAEKQAKREVLELQIAQLNEELKLFEDKDKVLPAKIGAADRTRTAAKDKLTARVPQTGASTDELIKWSSTDSAEPESWRSIQHNFEDLQALLERKTTRLTKLDELIAGMIEKNPALLGNIEEWDAGVLKRVHKVDYTAVGNKAIEQFVKYLTERNDLETEINTTHYTALAGYDEPLSALVPKIERTYKARKRVVEDDPATKEVCDTYHKAESALQALNDQKTDTDTRVAILTAAGRTKDVVSEDLKKRKEELEHLEEPTGKEKEEIQLLETLIPLLQPDNIQAMDNRIKVAEQGKKVRYTPYWENYPPVIKRLVNYLFGDKVMLEFPDAESKKITEKVKYLVRSGNYLGIIIDTIENSTGIKGGPYEAFKGAGQVNGMYAESAIKDVFYSDADINKLPPSRMNRDLVLQIVQNLGGVEIKTT